MLYSLENDFIRITVDSHGAELRSLTEKKDDTEYLWNGDPSWWKYTSPVLFPIVGKVINNTYTVNGEQYELPQHGLARTEEFQLESKTAESISFSLHWSTSSLDVYPYKFILRIAYRLDGNKVAVHWTVENDDDQTMYFNIGAHPALLCPIVQSDTIEDCYLLFNQEEHVYKLGITPDVFLTKDRIFSFEGTELPLSFDWFKNGVAIYDALASNTISICSRTNDKKISLTAKGFPFWGLWMPERGGSPFLCIEPWFGHTDYADFTGDFSTKEDIQVLAPKSSFEATYSLDITP